MDYKKALLKNLKDVKPNSLTGETGGETGGEKDRINSSLSMAVTYNFLRICDKYAITLDDICEDIDNACNRCKRPIEDSLKE